MFISSLSMKGGGKEFGRVELQFPENQNQKQKLKNYSAVVVGTEFADSGSQNSS